MSKDKAEKESRTYAYEEGITDERLLSVAEQMRLKLSHEALALAGRAMEIAERLADREEV